MSLVKKSYPVGVIFDVDGTLLDSMPIWDTAGERYLKKLNIQAEKNLGKRLFAMTMTEGAKYIKETYRLEQTLEEIIEGINKIVNEFYFNEVKVKSGVIDFFKYLKLQNIPITIATSSDRPLIQGAFHRLGISPYIDAIFTCTEVGVGKDKPDIYYKASDFMNTEPQNTYVFEDALHAIHTAKNAGFNTVGVFDAVSLDKQEQIRLECDYYITSFYEIESIVNTINRRLT